MLIIDDEPIAIEVIRELAIHLTTDLEIAGTATNGEEALEKIARLRPDLVFMDVDMPYMNGLEVLRKWASPPFHTILTTGYESQDLKTFGHEAVDYLLKPIDPADFLTAVEKARQMQAAKHNR